MTVKDLKDILNGLDETLNTAEVAVIGATEDSSNKFITDFAAEDIYMSRVFRQKALIIDISKHNTTVLE